MQSMFGIKAVRSCLFAFPGYCITFYFGNWLNSPSCFWSLSADLAAGRSGWPVIAAAEDYWEARTVCLDPYWVNQWMKHYDFGLIKRGFLGAILKIFTGEQVNILLLNLLFFVLGFALISVMVLAIRSVSPLRGGSLALFAFLISVSPVAKVIVETAGDPLHVIALLCFLTVFIGSQLPASVLWLRPWLFGGSFVIANMIYEGSYLLLLPFLFIDRKLDFPRVFCLVVSTCLLLSFSRPEVATLGAKIAGEFHVFNPANGLHWAYRDGGGIASSVGFMFNINQEFAKYLREPLASLFRALRSFVPSFSVLLILDSLMRWRSLRVSTMFARESALIVAVGLPFFLITHDWFRYGMFVIYMALIVVYCRCGLPSDAGGSGIKRSVILPSAAWVCFVPLVALVMVGPLTADLRTGFPEHVFPGSLLVLLLACLARIWSGVRCKATLQCNG